MIEVDDTRQAVRRGARARRRELHRGRRQDHGPARPERRGQVDVPPNPLDRAHPDRGSARIGGTISRRRPLAARRLLGVLPHGSGLYPQLTARENIEYYGRLHGSYEPLHRGARRQALIARLDLGAIASRKAKGYSQGERTKVALARALDPRSAARAARRAHQRPRRDGDAASARLAARAPRARPLRAAVEPRDAGGRGARRRSRDHRGGPRRR